MREQDTCSGSTESCSWMLSPFLGIIPRALALDLLFYSPFCVFLVLLPVPFLLLLPQNFKTWNGDKTSPNGLSQITFYFFFKVSLKTLNPTTLERVELEKLDCMQTTRIYFISVFFFLYIREGCYLKIIES